MKYYGRYTNIPIFVLGTTLFKYKDFKSDGTHIPKY